MQLNYPQDQVNSGVFYMRATPATNRFLQLVNDLGSTKESRSAVRARIRGNFGIDDQAVFNYVLLCRRTAHYVTPEDRLSEGTAVFALVTVRC